MNKNKLIALVLAADFATNHKEFVNDTSGIVLHLNSTTMDYLREKEGKGRTKQTSKCLQKIAKHLLKYGLTLSVNLTPPNKDKAFMLSIESVSEFADLVAVKALNTPVKTQVYQCNIDTYGGCGVVAPEIFREYRNTKKGTKGKADRDVIVAELKQRAIIKSNHAEATPDVISA